jgi:hypothetical protein
MKFNVTLTVSDTDVVNAGNSCLALIDLIENYRTLKTVADKEADMQTNIDSYIYNFALLSTSLYNIQHKDGGIQGVLESLSYVTSYEKLTNKLALIASDLTAAKEGSSVPQLNYVPGNNSVTLTWTAVSNAEKYAVAGYVSGKWQKLAEGYGTTYVLKNLKAGTNYKVAVVAKINGNWKLDFSNAITVTPSTPAIATTKYPEVTAQVSRNQFKLQWTAVPNAQKYGIAVYESGKWVEKVTLDGNTFSYISPKLAKGTYKMVVCAKINGEWDLTGFTSRAFTVTIS